MTFFRKYPFAPATIFLFASIILLSLPGTSLPNAHWLDIPQLDKLIHGILFCLLCWLFSYPITLKQIPSSRKKSWFWVVTLAGIGYGTAMEFVQKNWIPNRSFELLDIGADTFGCFLALTISYSLQNRAQSRSSS